MRIWPCAVLLPLFLLLLGGCSDFSFYWQAASGHLDLMGRKQDINELLENPRTDPKLKRKLRLVEEVREFAATRLDLRDNLGYTGYVDLGRPYVTMVVSAAPELSLEPHHWCYWFIGCQEYRGFFDEAEAHAYATAMDPRFDVSVRPVTAYSTLGWLSKPWIPDYFSNPVLSTILNRNDPDMVATLIHEMAHQVVYVEDDTSFNESFAVFVEEEGVQQFYTQSRARNTRDYNWYLRARRDRERFRKLVLEALVKLKSIYAEPVSDHEKRLKKKKTFRELKQAFAGARDEFEILIYNRWFSQELNNSHLLGVRRYHRDTKAFRRMFQAEGSQWEAFYKKVRKLSEETLGKRTQLLKQYQ